MPGVKTTSWGPCAWVVLHGLSKAIDGKPGLSRDFNLFIINLQSVLPCVHCRRSLTKFYKGPPRRSTGYSRFMYTLHNKVNKKLLDQQGATKAARREYIPKFKDVTYRTPNDPEWAFALATFMTYAQIDWSPERETALTMFIPLLLKLLDGPAKEKVHRAWRQCNDDIIWTNELDRLRWVRCFSKVLFEEYRLGKLPPLTCDRERCRLATASSCKKPRK